MDPRYIREWSLGLDVKLLLATVPAILAWPAGPTGRGDPADRSSAGEGGDQNHGELLGGMG
jgi:hypothetical protein